MPSQIKWLGIIRSDLGMYQKENYLSKVLCAVRHKKNGIKPQNRSLMPFLAESEGFEPSVLLKSTLVFETSSFGHSDNSPY